MTSMEENINAIRRYIEGGCPNLIVQEDTCTESEEKRKVLQTKIAEENLKPVVYVNPMTIKKDVL